MERIPTVRIIIQQNNKILLLLKSSRSKQAGKYEFPGGKIDDSEISDNTLALNALRELKEETDISIEREQLRRINIQNDYDFTIEDQDFSRRVFYFLANISDDVAINVGLFAEDKHVKHKWFTIDEYNKALEGGNNFKISPNSVIENIEQYIDFEEANA